MIKQLEKLLGIEENNLPLPNAVEWELKTHKSGSAALVTLFHMEPSPRALKLVPSFLLPKYGWPHKKAGTKYPSHEKSFRQTIPGTKGTNRGFSVYVDYPDRKVLISFDSSKVDDPRHELWLSSVREKAGLAELDPQPYWGFDDLFHKAATKLHNCFFVEVEVKKEDVDGKRTEFYHYSKIWMLRGLSLDKFLKRVELGEIVIDFDARTGHNHGTKFRLKSNHFQGLYEEVVPF